MNLNDKILFQGSAALNKSELLSILIDDFETSTKIQFYLKDLIDDYDDNFLSISTDVLQLAQIYGLTLEKSSKLSSLIELIKRYSQKTFNGAFIRNEQEGYAYFKNFQYLKREHLKTVYLNSQNKIVGEKIIAIGDATKILANPLQIFKPAFEYSSYAIILGHNHPSGDPRPSKEDILSTKKLVKACKILNIRLLDHFIIGKDAYSSLKALKIIKS